MKLTSEKINKKINETINKIVESEAYYSLYDTIYSIKCKIKNIFIGIKNIIVFSKVIYKFRAWDYSYTLNVIKKCLELQAIDLLDCGQKEGYNQILETLKYLDNYINSDEQFELLESTKQLTKTIDEIKEKNKKDDKTNTEYNDLMFEYICKSQDFEKDNWNNFFISMKNNMGNWWT